MGVGNRRESVLDRADETERRWLTKIMPLMLCTSRCSQPPWCTASFCIVISGPLKMDGCAGEDGVNWNALGSAGGESGAPRSCRSR